LKRLNDFTLFKYIGDKIKKISRLSFSTNSNLFALHAYALLGRIIPST
jgi:hypothetical protein